jgi:hypothetical protein
MNFENFIINNYESLGMKKCSEILGLSKGKIQTIVTKNNLKVNKKSLKKILSNAKIKKNEDYKVNANHFTINLSKESTYILGLLWADGYISNNVNENLKQKYNINLECVDDDMIYFKLILDKLGNWNYYSRQRDKYKPITKATTSNRKLLEYLVENDYNNKSLASPCSIIKTIPNDLLKYFLLGIIDGDGCFYFNKKHFLRQFTICGSLNQDWTAFEKIFNNLNIIYQINRKPNSKNGSSEIRILNKTNIKKLGDYIYDTIIDDNIGLKRKYFKYLEIIK